jgi:hypothetical protein
MEISHSILVIGFDLNAHFFKYNFPILQVS